MFRSRKRYGGALAVLALAVAAVAPSSASAKTTITMSGSTTVAPLAAKLARGYLKACHKCVKFRLLQGGSNIGIADVAKGRVTIGNSSRDPASGDPGGLVFNRIARDSICIVTNKANPVGNLSQSQIQSIYSAGVASWSGVPGAGVGGTIDLNGRTAASGTHDAFQKLFMDPKKVSSSMAQRGSNGLVQQAVKSDNNAIGYVSLAFTGGLNNVAYNGVTCTLRNAKSGQYTGTRNLYMVTRGSPTGAAKTWIKWITRSSAAAKIVQTEWVPA